MLRSRTAKRALAMLSKKHTKRLARIARRKAAKEKAKTSQYRFGDKGSVYVEGVLIGRVVGSEAYNFS